MFEAWNSFWSAFTSLFRSADTAARSLEKSLLYVEQAADNMLAENKIDYEERLALRKAQAMKLKGKAPKKLTAA